MPNREIIGSLHTHTTYSDGTGNRAQVAANANAAGLDFLIITDHNAFQGEPPERYGKTLMLTGQEVHDPAAPPGNHLLIFSAAQNLADYASDTRALVAEVREAHGMAFVAHPYETASRHWAPEEFSWRRWDVEGYHGIELWNYMSEFKAHLMSMPRTLRSVFWPKSVMQGPNRETLAKWDELLGYGRMVAVFGSDAHATWYHIGPLRKQIFGYRRLFRALSNHLYVPADYGQSPERDAAYVYEALYEGRSFMAYDGLAKARGFRFWAEYGGKAYSVGDQVVATRSVRLCVRSPRRAHLRLILNGYCVAEARGKELVFDAHTPGSYRVEAYRPYLFRERGWVFTNPIWLATRAPDQSKEQWSE